MLRIFQIVGSSVAAGDLTEAVRWVDRALRCTSPTAIIEQLLGQLLMATADFPRALVHLRAAAELHSTPEHEAVLLAALVSIGHSDEALDRLGAALSRYGILPEGPLAAAATLVITATEGGGPPGWLGLAPGGGDAPAPGMQVVGGIAIDSPCCEIKIATASGSTSSIAVGSPHTPVRFRFHLPEGWPAGPLTASADGIPLAGSPLRWPPDFAADGRLEADGDRLEGWATLGWLPSHPLGVTLEDDAGRSVTPPMQADETASPPRRSFSLSLAESGLHGPLISASIILPDGRQIPFPDAPLLLTVDTPKLRATTIRSPRWAFAAKLAASRAARRPIDIIVPVYRGRDETLACLNSLVPATGNDVAIVVVDDASPEPDLPEALDALAAIGAITLLRNAVNRGFPASVNRALTLHPGRDAVVVNADTVVHGDWLERLRAAAYAAPGIGTVTPLSNRGSIASYPGGDGTDLDGAEAAVLHGLAASVNSRTAVEIPVGVGFCLYLRRDCLDDVGLFDEATFAAGYGEENDLCMRARQRGWRHVLAADVFVHHLGSRSFGGRRAALMQRNGRLLEMRYPGYQSIIDDFVARDPLAVVRRSIDEVRLRTAGDRFVLLVTLALPGGVARVVQRRCAVLKRAGLRPLVLQPVPNANGRCRLDAGDDSLGDLAYDIPAELDALASLIHGLEPVGLELHHFLDVPSVLIERLLALPCTHDVYVHDYSWVCPRLTLLSGAGTYCGEPEPAACETCIETHGSGLTEPVSVAELRIRSARWLQTARRVVAPSADTARRLHRYFPGLQARIRPWERGTFAGSPPTPSPRVIRIAIAGAVGVQKGYDVLLGCARDAAARDLPVEFVLVGYSEDDERLLETRKVFVTGRYDEAEVAGLLRRERPHLAFVPSVTPETWCFALTHLLRSGLPIVGFDLGATADRLRDSGIGVIVPLATDPARLNDLFMRIADGVWQRDAGPGPGTKLRSDGNVAPMTMKSSKTNDGDEDMAMDQTLFSETRPGTLTSSAEVLTVTQGLYLFYVRSAAPVRTAAGVENITVPAVTVGVGPGVSTDRVEFISGPDTRGNWLCEPGNMLVVKVSGGPMALVVTSVRAIGGQPLEVEVERLDARIGANMQGFARPDAAEALRIARLEQATPPGNGAMFGFPEAPPVPLEPKVTAAAKPWTQASVGGASSTSGDCARLEIGMHVQNQGDLSFVDPTWAGGVGQSVWIEGFSIRPLDGLAADEIEYKGLTASGYETPWTVGGELCGTRGMAIPLVAFAVRVRPRAGVAPLYDCEYSGRFLSDTIVGPLSNGAPCRSPVPNDTLQAIQVRFVGRKSVPGSAPMPTAAAVGPRFSKLREPAEAAAPEFISATPWAPTGGEAAPSGIAHPLLDRGHEKEVETGVEAGSAMFQATATAEPASKVAFAAAAVDEGAPLSRQALMKRLLPFLTA